MSLDAKKEARKARAAEAERKRKRAIDRLDGKEPEPEFKKLSEEEAEAEVRGFTHGSIAPVTTEEAFAKAREALLDVTTPKDGVAKARAAEEAVRKMHGFTWSPDELGLPPAIPIRPLGKRKSQLYFLDMNDEFIELTASKLSQQGEIDNLFGTPGYLWSFFGKQSSNGELRIKYEDVRRTLIAACSRLVSRHGLFDPMRRVRGRGAWRTDSGTLVLHLGSHLWIDGVEHPLGEVEGHVYARDVDLSAPASVEALSMELSHLFYEANLLDEDDKSKAPGRWMLQAFQTWNWKRPELDPRLVLGYVVCVFLGAALKWRPAIYPIGDKASGKSSLLALVKAVLGDRLMDLADPSGPGIYQSLGLAAIGVWADEFEQEGDSASDTRAAAVMRLARYASDGKNVVRGGAEGVPTNYQARGTFGFTGINPPPMKPAELSRIAMPMLAKLQDASAKAPELSVALGDELGRHMLRRIVDRWHEWPDVLDAWRKVLLNHGHDSRAADTFGTLLAASHLVLQDGVPLPVHVEKLAKDLPRSSMNETQDDRANWEKCIDRLLQSQPDAWRQYRYRSVGEFLTAFVDGRAKDDADEVTPVGARDRLATAGMGLVTPREGSLAGKVCLAVPNTHTEVAKLFERSLWSMGVGAVHGGWVTALKFAPENVADGSKQRIDGRLTPCTLLALDQIVAPAGDDVTQTPRAA